MAVQTNYPDTQPVAVAGAQATMIPATVISRTVEGNAAIGFGKPVAQGTADKGCHLFTSGDTAVLGITLLDRSAAGQTVSAGQVTAHTPDARIITKGDVWVEAAAAVSAGDSVYATTSGTLTNTSGSGNVQIAGARWDTSTTAPGQLAVVRLG
jgi:hypothetical protein